MASTAIRERRRTLRYRNLLVRQMVQMKNKIGMLLMEAGVRYNKQRLHQAGYFRELLATNPEIDEGLCSLLRQCRETVVRLGKTESALIRSLRHDGLLAERVERLMSIPAIGPITALTWALEIGEVRRFSSIKKAISYCGLCGAEKSSGQTFQRTLFRQRQRRNLLCSHQFRKLSYAGKCQIFQVFRHPRRHTRMGFFSVSNFIPGSTGSKTSAGPTEFGMCSL
jgi:transposase